jgi:N-methylhydantoinase A
MLMTDLRADFTKSTVSPLDAAQLGAVHSRLAELRASAEEWFSTEGILADDRSLETVLDLRYAGQSHELRIEVPEGPVAESWLEAVHERFHEAHRRRYGFANSEAGIEVTTYRVGAIGAVPAASFLAEPLESPDASDAIVGSRDIYLPEHGERRECPLYDRERLRPGNVVVGPAVVEQYDSTTFLLPGETARVDQYGLIHTEQS